MTNTRILCPFKLISVVVGSTFYINAQNVLVREWVFIRITTVGFPMFQVKYKMIPNLLISYHV